MRDSHLHRGVFILSIGQLEAVSGLGDRAPTVDCILIEGSHGLLGLFYGLVAHQVVRTIDLLAELLQDGLLLALELIHATAELWALVQGSLREVRIQLPAVDRLDARDTVMQSSLDLLLLGHRHLEHIRHLVGCPQLLLLCLNDFAERVHLRIHWPLEWLRVVDGRVHRLQLQLLEPIRLHDGDPLLRHHALVDSQELVRLVLLVVIQILVLDYLAILIQEDRRERFWLHFGNGLYPFDVVSPAFHAGFAAPVEADTRTAQHDYGEDENDDDLPVSDELLDRETAIIFLCCYQLLLLIALGNADLGD